MNTEYWQASHGSVHNTLWWENLGAWLSEWRISETFLAKNSLLDWWKRFISLSASYCRYASSRGGHRTTWWSLRLPRLLRMLAMTIVEIFFPPAVHDFFASNTLWKNEFASHKPLFSKPASIVHATVRGLFVFCTSNVYGELFFQRVLLARQVVVRKYSWRKLSLHGMLYSEKTQRERN